MIKYQIKIESLNTENILTYPDFSPLEIKNQELLSRKRGINNFLSNEVIFTPLKPKYIGEFPPSTVSALADFHDWIEKKPKGLMYPISEKFKNLLDNFNLPPHRFYKAEVEFNSLLVPYFIMHLDTSYFEKLIAFDKSTFCNWHPFKLKKIDNIYVEASSVIELNDICEKRDWRAWGFNNVVMKEEFENLDLCSLQSWNIVISERLKNAIERTELKGIKITKYPVEFELLN